MYHDSNSKPWKLDKKWEDLSPKEWIEVRSYFAIYFLLSCDVVRRFAATPVTYMFIHLIGFMSTSMVFSVYSFLILFLLLRYLKMVLMNHQIAVETYLDGLKIATTWCHQLMESSSIIVWEIKKEMILMSPLKWLL